MVQIRCENSASYKQRKKGGKINREASFVWPFSLIQCTKMRKYLKEYKKSVTRRRGMAEKELGSWHGGAVWLTSDRWTAVWGGEGSEMRNGDEEWRWGSSVSAGLKSDDKLKEPLKTASKGALSCVWFWLWDHKCKGIYENSMSFEFWKLKTAKMCFQFP